MKYIFFILTSWFFLILQSYAASNITRDTILHHDVLPENIINNDGTLIGLVVIAQSILLKIVLPVVVIGASIYIAYELFTAEGDESKLKKAWKSVAYTAVALIAIALSYAIVSIVSRITL